MEALMMPDFYIGLDGTRKSLDLDSVIDVVNGWSARRQGWQAFIIYVPQSKCFVELQSTPPDVRGNSASESEEVTEQYVLEHFFTSAEMNSFKHAPTQWKFIARRA
jgi:hypothetical protein